MKNRSSETIRKRPLLINILIGIHTVFALFIIAIITNGLLGQIMHFPKFLWTMLFIVILASSIVGMWKGKPYGWWCSLLLYTSGILQNSLSILLGVSTSISLDILLGIIKLIVLLFLFRIKYRKFFEVESIYLPKAIMKVSLASILFIGAMLLFFGVPQS